MRASSQQKGELRGPLAALRGRALQRHQLAVGLAVGGELEPQHGVAVEPPGEASQRFGAGAVLAASIREMTEVVVSMRSATCCWERPRCVWRMIAIRAIYSSRALGSVCLDASGVYVVSCTSVGVLYTSVGPSPAKESLGSAAQAAS